VYFLRRFEHGDWTVAVEDDDRVVYAYLLRHNQIVGDVWLYNRPRSTAVDEFTLMPPVVLAGTPTPHHCASILLACRPEVVGRARAVPGQLPAQGPSAAPVEPWPGRSVS
jgi:hypothetical protein